METKCPKCGATCTEASVVGKTTTRMRGERTTYDVVCCKCGNTFRGNAVGPPVKLERRR